MAKSNEAEVDETKVQICPCLDYMLDAPAAIRQQHHKRTLGRGAEGPRSINCPNSAKRRAN